MHSFEESPAPADTALLDFRQAVERLGRHGGAAFALCPFADETTSRAEPGRAGANLYVITEAPADEPRRENPDYRVYYVGGRYGTTSLARETYRPFTVPLEAQQAKYRPLKEFSETLLHGDLKNIHQELTRRAQRSPG